MGKLISLLLAILTVIGSCINMEKSIKVNNGYIASVKQNAKEFTILLNEKKILVLMTDDTSQISISPNEKAFLDQWDKLELESRKSLLIKNTNLSKEDNLLLLRVLDILISWPSNLALYLNSQPGNKNIQNSKKK